MSHFSTTTNSNQFQAGITKAKLISFARTRKINTYCRILFFLFIIFTSVVVKAQQLPGNFYGAPVNFTTGSGPRSVTTGDIDGDGKPDLVVVNRSAASLSVLRNTSVSGSITASSFAAKVDFATGSDPFFVVVKDLDGDGKVDLAVVNNTSNTVSVLRNTSTIGVINASSFAPKVDFATGLGPITVAVADLDGDGKLEIVAVNHGGGVNTVSVLYNTTIVGVINASSFAAKVDFATGIGPWTVAIGDLDGDTKPDLAVANINTDNVSVLRNTSTTGVIDASSFAAKVDFTAGDESNFVTIDDIDADAKGDLVVGNFVSGDISILRNTSTSGIINAASFAGKVDFLVGGNPQFIVTGDVDMDSKKDIIIANTNGYFSIFRNTAVAGVINGSSLSARTDFAAPSSGTSITIADLDGDGIQDIAMATGASTISVFRVVPPKPVVTSLSPATGPVGTSVTITGLNFNPIVANNIVYFGAVKATVTSASATSLTVTSPAGATYKPLSVLDATTGLSGYSSKPFITTFANPFGTGIPATFYKPKVNISTGTYTGSVVMGDLDGDGKAELISANGAVSNISVFRNISAGGTIAASSFAPKTDLTTATNVTSVAIGDVDGDGKSDLVVICPSFNIFSVFRNTSTPSSLSFAARVDINMGNAATVATMGDIDGDGKPEVITASNSTNIVSVFRNLATPGAITSSSFAGRVDFATGNYPISVTTGDFDGDGNTDIATANFVGSTVSVLRNTTVTGFINATSFAAKVDFAVSGNPSTITNGDVDGDGKTDIVATRISGGMSVFRNTAASGSINASSFTVAVDFTASGGSRSGTLADLDGDSKPDIAVANDNSNNASVLQNLASLGSISISSFATKSDFDTDNNPGWLIVGDLNGDGIPEIITANSISNSLSILQIETPAIVTTTAVSSVTNSQAFSGGNVTSDGGNAITARGVAYGLTINPTTSNGITADGTGTGTFVSTLPGLTANTKYFYRAYAINSITTSYGAESSFYTLANVPVAPVLSNATITTLDISIGSGDNNPSFTKYAIFLPGNGQYLQANGSLGASAVWQTATQWGTTTVTGLTSNASVDFGVKARNEDNIETAFGPVASKSTLAITPGAPVVNNATPSTLDVTINANGNASFTVFAIHESIANKYVQANGTLGVSPVWQTAAVWGTKTVTGLTSLTTYTFEVKARNQDNVETAFGSTASLLLPCVTTVHNINTGLNYCTIQAAIDDPLTLNGHVISIDAGTYAENVIVTKELEIKGQGAGFTIIVPAASNANTGGGSLGGSNVFLVQADNVTIHDLTIDGDNTLLPGGFNAGGANIDARNGIITNHEAGVYNNLSVHHVSVRNIYLRAIYASSGGTFNFSNNTVSNVKADAGSIAIFNFGGGGTISNNNVSDVSDAIATNHSTGTVISNNTVTNSSTGVHSDNNGSGGTGTADDIYGNTISNSKTNGYGIFVFAAYKAVTVHENTISNVDVGMASTGQYAAVTPVFSDNRIDGQNKPGSTGMYATTQIWGFGDATNNTSFINNYVINNADGFYLETSAGYVLNLGAHFNSITGNTNSNAAEANAGTLNADMTCNWWGTTSAATIAASIPAGVTFVPFLASGADADAAIGFQTTQTCSGCTLTLSSSSTDETCPGNNGTASVNASAGTGVYTYVWSTGATTVTITGLAGGTYSVTVTDQNGCTASTNVTVNSTTGSGPVTVVETGTQYCTIQAAIDAATTLNGHHITVNAGNYEEDVTVNKSVIITGAGAATTFIKGVFNGSGSTVAIAANNVEISGFTITRLGNNITDWNGPINLAGVSVQGLAITGMLLHNNIITGNRTGVDINNSNGHTIRNNAITDNRTGLVFRNQTDNITFSENEVTNNWTAGIIFLDGSTETNNPVQTASGSSFFNNNISGNWYGQIVDRQTGGSLPAPGGSLKDFSGNWLGSVTPLVTTDNTTEPGYAAQIPVAFGGSATAPGGQPDIAGTASANIDYTSFLNSGIDINAGVYGFQGDFSALWVTPAGGQTGTTGRVQEGINLVTAGGLVNVLNGTYNEDIEINKNITVAGQSAAAIIRGLYAGSANTVFISASNATLKNITVTRDWGTTQSDWDNCTKNQGIIVAQLTTGIVIDNVVVTGNRNGIYINNAQNITIQNSVIEANRTGVHFANNVSGCIVKNNFIRDNFTHGVLLNFDTPPGIAAPNLLVNNNSITGNWYSQVNFQHNNNAIPYGSLTGLDFTCNWYGTVNVTAVAANAAEPGYAGQIPSQLGGINPGLNRQLYGTEIALCPYSTWLTNGNDDDESTAGFQPVAGSCNGSAIVINSITATAAGCSPANSGTATVVATGGVAPLTYSWNTSPVQATATAIGLLPGIYIVTITDNVGATTSASVTVDPPSGGPVTVIETGTQYCTIQAAIDAATTLSGHHITVDAGNYEEDVTVNKSLTITGAGAATTFIKGVFNGSGSTVAIAANNVEISGFTITRLGNNVTDWNGPINITGVSVQGLAITGMLLHDNIITQNRTAVDINNSNGHIIRNNIINDNNTGLIFRNQTDDITVSENTIIDNRTTGILFLDASGGTNSPVQTAANCNFSNNNISGNWYGQIVDRQSGGSLPVAGTNLKNFSGNWFGTNTPVVTTANSTEPGYAAHIPLSFGGTAVAPGGQPDIAGPASANFDYTPYLNAGTDTDVETTPGRGVFGFQGSFSNLWVTAASSQSGAATRIQEGINSVSGSTVNITAGTYNENVLVNKSVNIIGAGTGSTILTPSVACTGDGMSITAANVNVSNLTVTNYTYGVRTSAANITLTNVESNGNCQYGLITNTGTNNLDILNSKLNNNIVGGWRAGTGDQVNDVTIDNCEVKNNGVGVNNGFGTFIAAQSPGANMFDNITIKNSDFSGNLKKGLYFEKLNHALIDNVTINNSGTDATYGFNNGIDINLKFDAYTDIVIQNSSITNSGAMGTATDVRNPAAVTVKARDDASAYNTDPASLTGFVFTNNFVSGLVNGIRFGEFGKANAGPTGNTVLENHFGNAYSNKAMLNETLTPLTAECNWFGTTGSGAIAALVSGAVDYSPYLLNGTDNSVNPGFQPVPGSCGTSNNLYVNNAYVIGDDHYTTAAGSDIAGTGTTSAPYATIQKAINAASAGDVIWVDAGTYTEDIILNKNVTLKGSKFGINPNTVSAVAESIVYPATSNPDINSSYTTIMSLDGSLNGVIIDGFVFDGNNPNLTSGIIQNGADIDASDAIGAFGSTANITITNNVIRNVNYTGVDIYPPNNSAATVNTISDNKLHNIMAPGAIGILVYNNFYADIDNNVMTAVSVGVQTGNFHLAKPVAGDPTISGNTIESSSIGIWHNLAYQGASDYTIANNTLTTFAGATANEGIEISSIQSAVGVTVSNNNVTGARAGIDLWNCPTTSTVTITGGTLTNCNVGVFANNYDGYNSDAITSAYAITGVNFSNCDTAIWVKDNSNNSNGAFVTLNINNTTNVVNGTGIGLLVEGADAFVNFSTGVPVNFSSSLSKYIRLISNGTNTPVAGVNAENVQFGGLTGGAMSLTQLFATEDKIDHKIDWSSLGYVSVKANNDYVTLNSFYTPVTSVPAIQRGVDAASNGYIVNVDAGTFNEPAQVSVNKNITVRGAGNASTIVKPTVNTTVGGNLASESFIYIDPAATVTLEKFTIDGADKQIHHAIQSRGVLTADDLTIRNIKYQQYFGRGIVLYAGAGNSITNITFSNIERIGVHVRGGVALPLPVTTINGIIYTGKGTGDFLDYGVEIGGGGSATITNSVITNNKGQALVDMSKSAGILATTFFGPGTTANISNNYINNNTDGISVGFDGTDVSVVTAHYNDLSGNTGFAISSTAPAVNATCNWYGTVASGAIAAIVSPTIAYSPYLLDGTDSQPADIGFQTTAACAVNNNLYVNDVLAAGDHYTTAAGSDATGTGTPSAPYATIQKAVSVAAAGDVIWVDAGLYAENPTVNKSVTINGSNMGTAGAASRPELESIVRTNGNQPNIFTVSANNVSINGFSMEGNDPSVSGVALTSGDDANAAHAIRTSGTVSGLAVKNNIVKHVSIGVRAEGLSTSNIITQNWFDGIGAYDFGYAISLRTNFYADVTDNKMTRVWTGLHTNNFNGASGPATWTMSGNEVHSYAAGLWYNLQYNGATGLTVNNNQFSAEAGAVANNFGILMVSIQDAVNPSFTNNTITGTDYGIAMTNVPTSNTITLGATNSITGTKLSAVLLSNNLPLNFANPIGLTVLGPSTGAASVKIGGISINAATGNGIQVDGFGSGAPVYTLNISNPTTLNNGVNGLVVNGPNTAIAGNTINNLSFVGQTGKYIRLSNTALAGLQIDATATCLTEVSAQLKR